MQAVPDSAAESKADADTNPLFSLVVRQQPERARLCSYKEENETMDRRPVDPPPVVELRAHNSSPGRVLESTSFFIRATTVSSTSVTRPVPDHGHLSVMLPVYAPVKTPTGADATTGEVVQTPEKLRLLDGRVTALCIFAKLSVRVPGVFRLMFTLYETSDAGMVQLTHTVSEPFEVFSPKLFKGMHESTPLTRHLAAQGLKVKLRTDTSVGRQSTSRRRADASTRKLEKRKSSSSLTSPAPAVSPAVPTSSDSIRPYRLATSLGAGPSHPLHTQSEPSLDRIWPHGSPPASHPGSLVWRASDDVIMAGRQKSSHEYRDGAEGGPGPSSARKRRYGDDGIVRSYSELASRFDWTPTPPATDLSAFSLSRSNPNPDPYQPRRDFPSQSLLGSSTGLGSQPSSHRSSLSSSVSSQRNISPFPSGGATTTSSRTRTSSARSDSQASNHFLPPLPYVLNIGSGDDGIPILPLPSMYSSTSATSSMHGSRSSGFTPPSISQILGESSASTGPSRSGGGIAGSALVTTPPALASLPSPHESVSRSRSSSHGSAAGSGPPSGPSTLPPPPPTLVPPDRVAPRLSSPLTLPPIRPGPMDARDSNRIWDRDRDRDRDRN